MNRFTVREAVPSDAAAIRRLFDRAFQKEMAEEEWHWKFERNPDGWFGTVAVADGEIVGNYAGWGVSLQLGAQRRLAYSVVDVATDPSVRAFGGRQGVFRSMAEAFYEVVRARGVPFCFGFPSPRAQRIGERLLDYRPLFPVRELRASCDAFPAPPAGISASDFLVDSFDPLWGAASRLIDYGAVRDRARANWRFHARPTRYYRMVTVEQHGLDVAWAVLSATGEEALVVDFLARSADEAELLTLFAATAAEARRLKARTLTFWEPPGGFARGALDQLSAERREAGFSFVARIFDEEAARAFAERAHVTPALYDVP